MYIDEVPNRSSRPTVLLRKGWREGKKTPKRTLANLTGWPAQKVEALRQLLRGLQMVPAEEAVAIERSLPHGHVAAVLEAIRRLGLEGLIASKRSRQRDLVIAMIVQHLIAPRSKLGTTRSWHTTTLAGELHVADADVDELYDALDWLLARQERIERKLAARHLEEGGRALYDVSNSHYEGRTCVLAHLGRDKATQACRLVIVYGVMTNARGCPVGVEVYSGDTGDPTTVPDQVEKLRGRFGLERIVLVGDRGMLTQARIDQLKEFPQLGWISALRSDGIRKLLDSGALQLSLFDRQDLAEIVSPDFPGERLVVCFNPLLHDERRRTREDLLGATEKELDKIARAVARRTRTPLTEQEIALRVGRVVHRFKVAKHFNLTIGDNLFVWKRNAESIEAEQALDGIYVIRTSEPAERLAPDHTVRAYKSLADVERAFRILKSFDIRVRPIRHRTEDHVRAHVFLCFLAYYVHWHMRQAVASLLFDDEDLQADRLRRDPVKPAHPSPGAQLKKHARRNTEGFPVHSFQTLLDELATQCRIWCRIPAGPAAQRPTHGPFVFEQLTEPTPLQERTFHLLEVFPGYGNSK